MFLALLLPHHYQSMNPKHKNPNQHSNTHALDQFTSSRQFTATPIQPPSSTKNLCTKFETLANQPHAIPPLPRRKQIGRNSPRFGTPTHVLSIPPHKYTRSVLESFQRPRPAEVVTNGHHELRRVPTRFVLAVHGRLRPSPGRHTNTQNTPLLATQTSVRGSENYSENLQSFL